MVRWILKLNIFLIGKIAYSHLWLNNISLHRFQKHSIQQGLKRIFHPSYVETNEVIGWVCSKRRFLSSTPRRDLCQITSVIMKSPFIVRPCYLSPKKRWVHYAHTNTTSMVMIQQPVTCFIRDLVVRRNIFSKYRNWICKIIRVIRNKLIFNVNMISYLT